MILKTMFIVLMLFYSSSMLGSQGCPIIDIPENVTVVSNTSSEINLTCADGFNHTGGDLHLLCVNGSWEGDTPTCRPIECRALTIDDGKNFNNYKGVNALGTVINLTCASGYHFGGNSHFTTVCNGNGQWEPDQPNFDFQCVKSRSYVGCAILPLLAPVFTDAKSTLAACRSRCESINSRYMVLANLSCICGDNVAEPFGTVDNKECNATCELDTVTSGFCGGNGNESSLYHVWGGCYDNVNTNVSVIKSVTGDMLQTCQRFCSGFGAFYSITSIMNSTCECADYINTDAKFTGLNMCTSYEEVHPSSYVYNTDDEDKNKYKDCEELYKDGVRLNGKYYLQGMTEPTACYFKDGTICDDNWIGHNGSCYLFNDNKMDFANSTSYCASPNSTLISLLDSLENEFVGEYLDVYSPTSTQWFTGLYSPLSDGVYIWTDGHLHQYTSFVDREPSVLADDSWCVVMNKNDKQWYSWKCDEPAGVICKKSANYGCAQFENETTINNDTLTTVHGLFSLTSCVQTCKGQWAEYAAVQNEDCRCFNQSQLETTNETFEKCNIPCTGYSGQMCGGDDAYIILKAEAYKGAQSCQELELLGIGGTHFYLQNTSSSQFCPDAVCLHSWIKGSSSCYKFISSQLKYHQMSEYCSKHDAYVVCLEEESETSFILSFVNAAEQYKDIDQWMTGLYAPITYAYHYKWFSNMGGLSIRSSMIPVSDRSNVYFGIKNDGIYKGTTSSSGYNSFICERHEGYQGCFEVQTSQITHQLTVYEYTDILQCIEWCRGLGGGYAMTGNSYWCACSDTLPVKAEAQMCTRLCNVGDPCGGYGNHVSVYDIDKYPQYNSCEELFQVGISLSGNYTLNGGHQQCIFYDGNTMCPEKWIGYEGKCYIGVNSADKIKPSNYRDQCTAIGASLATIYDNNLHTILHDYMTESSLFAGYSYTLLGLVDTFSLGSSTWASGDLTRYFPHIDENNLKEYFVLDGSKAFKNHFQTRDIEKFRGNALCERSAEYIGCFNTSNLEISPILSNWMELTLCKQLCIGNGTQYVGIQENACFCFNESVVNNMSQLTSSYCSQICPGHPFQYCGNDASVNVYYTNKSVLAGSCEELYDRGIFYNSVYLINISSNSTVETECGFADSTVCKAGWYGYLGTCYKLVLQHATYIEASKECLASGGLLINPEMTNIKFIKGILGARLFDSQDFWWNTHIDQFGNNRYLLSDGRKSPDTFTATFNLSESFNLFALLSSNGTLEKSSDDTVTLPYICQTSNEQIGCVEMSTIDANSIGKPVTHSGMTSTFCIQYCTGQDAVFAGISSLTTCQCYDSLMNYTRASSCLNCPGYPAQGCGSTDSISVYNTSVLEEEAFESCNELKLYGIPEPGWYYIKPRNCTKAIKVQCFVTDPSLMPVNVSSTLDASSSYPDHPASKARITWPFGFSDSWIPATNDSSQTLTFMFAEEVIITGIITQGYPIGKNSEWTETFIIKYWDSLYEKEETYSCNGNNVLLIGNSDRSSFSYNFLIDPIVTTIIKINPQTWNNWPAMRVKLLGQSFSLFNFSTSAVGCYHMTVDLKNKCSFNISASISECKLTCKQIDNPFYSFVPNNSHCYCWSFLPSTYGTFDDAECNSSDRLFVYRTYDKICPEPNNVPFSQKTSTTSAPGVYTYKSNITYICDIGYIYPDGNLSKSYVCGGQNQWSDNIQYCEVTKCDALDLPSHSSSDTNYTVYGNVVNVECDVGFTTKTRGKVQSVTCTKYRLWNSSLDDCELISCGAPPVIAMTTTVGDVFTYNGTVTYTCSKHMWFGQNQTDITVRCTDEGVWEDIPTQYTCTYYECEDPNNLLHASFNRVDSEITAYTCDKLYSFSDGSQTKNITCYSNFTWEDLDDECRREDEKVCYRTATSTVMKNIQRQVLSPSSVLSEFVPRSQATCASECLSNWQCQAYNYETNLCRLFNNKASSSDLNSDIEWIYFEKTDEELYSCE